LFELSENTVEFCRVNSLHLKAMEEMSKLRKQLVRLIFHHSQCSEKFSWKFGGSEDVEELGIVNLTQNQCNSLKRKF